jgi:hypothetical protein
MVSVDTAKVRLNQVTVVATVGGFVIDVVVRARLQLAHGSCELAHRPCDHVFGYLLCYVRWLDSQQ